MKLIKKINLPFISNKKMNRVINKKMNVIKNISLQFKPESKQAETSKAG